MFLMRCALRRRVSWPKRCLSEHSRRECPRGGWWRIRSTVRLGACADGSKSRDGSYVLAVPSTKGIYHDGRQRQARTVAKSLAEGAWIRASAGRGSKGDRLYDWACVPLPAPDTAEAGRWLLLRRDIDDPSEEGLLLILRAEGDVRWRVDPNRGKALGHRGLFRGG